MTNFRIRSDVALKVLQVFLQLSALHFAVRFSQGLPEFQLFADSFVNSEKKESFVKAEDLLLIRKFVLKMEGEQ